jgi:hypothetical protein
MQRVSIPSAPPMVERKAKGSRTIPLPSSEQERRDVIKKIHDRCYRDDDGCLIWEGPTSGNVTKYGSVYYAGLMRSAHRLVYVMHHNADLPSSVQVLHRCDKGLCCNLECLSPGTNQQNIIEAVERGRHVPCPGEANGNSVLTEDKVVDIKLMLLDGMSQKEVAKHFGVAHGTINLIATGKTWRHVNV